MFRILDRYLIREILLPLFLALVVLTFVLEIPPILREAEALIAKGVAWSVVASVLLTLLPQALCVTIPMAVLLGILIGLGRQSADREFVAMQACGISPLRLLRPMALVAALATAATAYETIVALPNANQSFREITTNVVADRIENNVKPGVFFEDFPNHVIYVRDLPPGGGWRDVFLADSTRADQTTAYFAREGRIIVDRAARLVQVQLKDGTRHTTLRNKPEDYEGSEFESIVLTLNPDTVFPRPPSKGPPEMTIAELRTSIAEGAKHADPGYSQRFMIQQKFSIPIACPVLALIGLALGISNRKGGNLASFVLGFCVIFVYYVLLWTSRDLALGGRLAPDWAPWIPNILLGVAGVVLMMWRVRSADQPIRIGVPVFWRPATEPRDPATDRSGGRRKIVVIRVPHLDLPRPSLLDRYIARQYLRVFFLGVFALLGIFYISTLMDLADKLFRGTTTTAMLLRFFYYETPLYVYYVIPMAVLVATLVTVGLMTKNSELVVMKACGVSLYRAAAPLVLFAIAAGALLFGLQERVLAYTNREADRLNGIIRGFPAQTFGGQDRRWLVGHAGDIYHYEYFDPRLNRFTQFMTYHLDDSLWRLDALTYAKAVVLTRRLETDGRPSLVWNGQDGWAREFTTARRKNVVRSAVNYSPFGERDLGLEPPEYFKTEAPDSEKMTYGQLSRYITQLEASGFDAVPQMVQLRRKVAFPFVTLIMTLLAVPFAVATGRRGALYGIGVGIVVAIVYWIMLSIFGALGEGGVVAPMLAAWAPNVLFGAAAAYMLLTVRT
jgi:LPS export ABC transporter permease LptF/LPS export ABC transporter permease LptG